MLFNPTTKALLCSDTIRRWFDVPHYKFFLDDPVNEANVEIEPDGNRVQLTVVLPTGIFIVWPEAYISSCRSQILHESG